MKNNVQLLKICIISLFILLSFIGYSNQNFITNDYSIKEFSNDMKNKSYEFKIVNANQGFLPTKRKRLILTNNEAIDIYLYKNRKDMEEDSKNIDSGGCIYSEKKGKGKIVDWASNPHFYKKGSVIVFYCGNNQKIISDLSDLLGYQFSGH